MGHRETSLSCPFLRAPADVADRFLMLRQLASSARLPRVGLRRWVLDSSSYERPDSRSKSVHGELHNDGAATFAIALDGWVGATNPDRHDVLGPLVESFAMDFVALAETVDAREGRRVQALRRDRSVASQRLRRIEHGAHRRIANGPPSCSSGGRGAVDQ
jgi:hypothetical protein